MRSKIAVLSDIHANADALSLVFEDLAESPVVLTIILGDILTYGMQPSNVLNLLKNYSEKNETVFIKGNHDQFYFDIQNNQENASYKVPYFVKESIHWTLKNIGDKKITTIFDWKDFFIFEGIYFSHANPFEYGNWSYLENPESIEMAFSEIAKKNCMIGVFGHSHRQLVSKFEDGGITNKSEGHFDASIGDRYIVNAGSVGQPRGNGFCYLTLDVCNNSISGDLHNLNCDTANTISMISNSSFSAETKDKLISYLRS